EQAHGGGNYGMGPSGKEYGGALCDLVKVPFAEQMLIPFPGELDPVDWASWSDNISESWKMVGQFLENGKSNRVLIMGGFAFSIALYCVILAKGMGAYVEYWDEDRDHLDKAEALGAKVVQVDWEKSNTIPKDRFSIVADASGSEAAFSLGMRHLTPGGDFTTAGIYWTNKILIPFLELYNTGASIHITRVSSRETMPKLLEKFQNKIFDPGKVRPVVALLADSKEAWQEPATKLVIKNY
ncbi:MAG: zinc-binding dehydrogenase, partial [Leptospira sp.]|nr:zinc-binding dehydrogenase [Leptospira sp.]